MSPEIHRARLRELFLIRPRNAGVPEFIVAGMVSDAIAACRAAIRDRVPMPSNGPMEVFLEFDGWYGRKPVEELFAAYVEAGYMPMNSASKSTALPLFPLEVAIGRSHLDFVRAALDNGADERLVPSRGNTSRAGQCGDATCKVDDVFELIGTDVSNQTLAAQMAALCREASMNRHIGALHAPSSIESTPRRRLAHI